MSTVTLGSASRRRIASCAKRRGVSCAAGRLISSRAQHTASATVAPRAAPSSTSSRSWGETPSRATGTTTIPAGASSGGAVFDAFDRDDPSSAPSTTAWATALVSMVDGNGSSSATSAALSDARIAAAPTRRHTSASASAASPIPQSTTVGRSIVRSTRVWPTFPSKPWRAAHAVSTRSGTAAPENSLGRPLGIKRPSSSRATGRTTAQPSIGSNPRATRTTVVTGRPPRSSRFGARRPP